MTLINIFCVKRQIFADFGSIIIKKAISFEANSLTKVILN